MLAGRIYARAANTVYLYGGNDNATYDVCPVTAQLPFLNAGKPGHYKQIQGVDQAATGTWHVDLLVDPDDEDVIEHVGDLDGVTFSKEFAAHASRHTHVAPKLTHEGEGFASLSNLAIYYEGADSQGGTE